MDMTGPSPSPGAHVKRIWRFHRRPPRKQRETGASAGDSAALAVRIAGLASLLLMAGTSLVIVAGAQAGLDELVPAAKLRYPGWLHGPLEPLQLDVTTDGLAWLLLALCAGYLGALACARAIPVRAGLAAIAGLH